MVTHTVKAFDSELRQLDGAVGRMGGLVQRQLGGAIKALANADTALAGQVVQDDQIVDALENEIATEAVRLLALRQPMAGDLREIVSTIKIAGDLERMADYAVNVAKRSVALGTQVPQASVNAMTRLARPVEEMLHEVLDAYADRSAEKASQLRQRDVEVDQMYLRLFTDLVRQMEAEPDRIGPYTHLLFMAKNIERIGDHITNVAETTHYMITGERLIDDRLKVEDGGISREDLANFD